MTMLKSIGLVFLRPTFGLSTEAVVYEKGGEGFNGIGFS